MNLTIYLYKNVVYIPTSYRVENKGFSFQDAPIESAPVEQTQRLREAILAAIARRNPPMSADKVRSLSGSKIAALLKATSARSWHVLDRQTTGLWGIAEKDGLYKIRVKRPMKPRGWDEDPEKAVLFPPGTPVDDVIARVIAMIQERARE